MQNPGYRESKGPWLLLYDRGKREAAVGSGGAVNTTWPSPGLRGGAAPKGAPGTHSACSRSQAWHSTHGSEGHCLSVRFIVSPKPQGGPPAPILAPCSFLRKRKEKEAHLSAHSYPPQLSAMESTLGGRPSAHSGSASGPYSSILLGWGRLLANPRALGPTLSSQKEARVQQQCPWPAAHQLPGEPRILAPVRTFYPKADFFF